LKSVKIQLQTLMVFL